MGLTERPDGGIPPTVKRRPIAALLPGAEGEQPLLEGVLRGLSEARPFDLETVALGSWGKGHRLKRPGRLRLLAHWARRPRVARPQLLLAPLGTAKVALDLGELFRIPVVLLVGREIGAPVEAPEAARLLRRASDVWVADDATARDLTRLGLRGHRVKLSPAAAELSVAPAGTPGSVCVLGPLDPDLHTAELGAAPRVARPGSVAVIGVDDERVRSIWAGLEPSWVANRPELRRAAIRAASVVWAPVPERVPAALVEALLCGRPVLAPRHRRPAWLEAGIGVSYGADRVESVADALTEIWASQERGQFDAEQIRSVGASEASEAQISRLEARLLALLHASAPD